MKFLFNLSILLFLIFSANAQSRIGVHWGNAVNGTSLGTMISVNSQLQPLNNGVKWIRTEISWHDIDTMSGTPYNWMQLEKNIDSLTNWGFKIIAMLKETPDWYTTNPNPTGNPQYNALYAPQDTIEWVQFLDSVVAKFGSKIDYWEIWNEPDGPFLLTPSNTQASKEDAYMLLLKSGYNKIKSFNDPNDSILLGGLTSRIILDKKIFFDNLFIDSAFKYFDIMNFHLYEAAYSFRDTLLAKMQAYGIANKPIWITETNPWRELAASGGNSLANTSNYLCTWINDTIINYFDPKVICWFNMRNWITSLGTVCDNCDSNQTAYGLFDSLYNPTALLPVFTNCLNTVGMEDNIEDNWSTAIFPNPTSGSFSLILPILPSNSELYIINMFGQKIYSQFYIANANEAVINMSLDLSSGIYFVTLKNDNFLKVRKFIVVQ